MTDATIAVSTREELYDALSRATGGETILLRPGNYGTLNLTNQSGIDRNFETRVTIRSADPADKAVFTAADVRGASNLAFEDLRFDYTFKAGDPIYARPFSFTGCQGLSIRNCIFDGDVARGVPPESDGFGTAHGLHIRASEGVEVSGNEIFGFHRGMELSTIRNLVIAGNDLHGMRMDGMTFAQVTAVTVEGNRLHDFRGSPTSDDHCDMIQFWTTGTTAPSTDIVIRDNLLDIGGGTATQSIFMRNERVDTGAAGAEMFYRNVRIENNTVINAHSHGITVGETTGLVIRNNSVLHADGGQADGADSPVEIPAISVSARSTGVVLVANVSSSIIGHTGQSDWSVEGNVLVQDQDPTKPGYMADLFISSSLKMEDGRHLYVAVPGGLIDRLGAGSDLTRDGRPELDALFDVGADGRAARVFDAGFSTIGGGALPEGTIYDWSFGDGTTARGTQVRHAYAEGGAYDVVLTLRLPDGRTANEEMKVVVQDPLVLSLEGDRFVAREAGQGLDLGPVAGMTMDGLQLGALGATQTIGRAHVRDIAGTDEFQFALSLDADQTGASGEVFRIHGSISVMVTAAGELQVQLFHDGTTQQTRLVTTGARLNAVADLDRDILIDLRDGVLSVHVDGSVRGSISTLGAVGGTRGFDSHGLVFGNPWGRANFAGDLDEFRFTVDASDFVREVTWSCTEEDLHQSASAGDLSGWDLLSLA